MLNIFRIILVLLVIQPVEALAFNLQEEIDHLLTFVEKTECLYERNGTRYNGVKAVQHIKNKYDYFKDDIDSAEKFIELSATKSTMSGKYYQIICSNKLPIKSQSWLLKELKDYRINLK